MLLLHANEVFFDLLCFSLLPLEILPTSLLYFNCIFVDHMLYLRINSRVDYSIDGQILIRYLLVLFTAHGQVLQIMSLDAFLQQLILVLHEFSNLDIILVISCHFDHWLHFFIFLLALQVSGRIPKLSSRF